MEIRFGLLDKVYYLNTARMAVESDAIKGIQIIPTGISKSEQGEDVLDGYEVLYSLKNGLVLTGGEVYASEEELLARLRVVLGGEEIKR